MGVAFKIILIIYGSVFSATSAWYVTFEPDFIYKSNMTFDETIEAFKQIKEKENHLKTDDISINGGANKLKDTLTAASMYNISYLDTLEKAIYFVKIYQEGYHQNHKDKKTHISFHYIKYTNGESIPFVRQGLKFRQYRRKRFETVVINKIRKELEIVNNQTNSKNRINRVIHYLQY